MSVIPEEAIPHFENAIYFPMLFTILENDKAAIEKGPFKLNKPYLNLVNRALNQIQKESKQTHDYFRRNRMKLIKGNKDELFTEYIFIYGRNEYPRRYLNVRLRNRTEELLNMYFGIN